MHAQPQKTNAPGLQTGATGNQRVMEGSHWFHRINPIHEQSMAFLSRSDPTHSTRAPSTFEKSSNFHNFNIFRNNE